jgi:hypothetical protein
VWHPWRGVNLIAKCNEILLEIHVNPVVADDHKGGYNVAIESRMKCTTTYQSSPSNGRIGKLTSFGGSSLILGLLDTDKYLPFQNTRTPSIFSIINLFKYEHVFYNLTYHPVGSIESLYSLEALGTYFKRFWKVFGISTGIGGVCSDTPCIATSGLRNLIVDASLSADLSHQKGTDISVIPSCWANFRLIWSARWRSEALPKMCVLK